MILTTKNWWLKFLVLYWYYELLVINRFLKLIWREKNDVKEYDGFLEISSWKINLETDDSN